MTNIHLRKKFTRHYIHTLLRASALSEHSRGHIDIEHIYQALLLEKGSIGCQILTEFSKPMPPEDDHLGTINSPFVAYDTVGHFSQRVRSAITKSVLIAKSHHHSHIGTEHLLAALLSLHKNFFEDLKGIYSLDSLAGRISAAITNASRIKDLFASLAAVKEQKNKKHFLNRGELLNIFTIHLSDPQQAHKYIDCACRDSEMERILHIIGRKTKHSPLLLAESGIGKTALIEGMAKKTIFKQFPFDQQHLAIHTLDKVLLNMNISLGDLEKAIKQFILELASRPNVLLCIDDIHEFIKSKKGTYSFGFLLVTGLVRANIRFLGTSTPQDFEKISHNHPNLIKKFQILRLSEPNTIETIQMLKQAVPALESHHSVHISDEILSCIVSQAHNARCVGRFPEKAFNILDEASSIARFRHPSFMEEKKLSQLESGVISLINDKKNALAQEDYSAAIKINNELKIVRRQITLCRKSGKLLDAKKIQVTMEDVSRAVKDICGHE